MHFPGPVRTLSEQQGWTHLGLAWWRQVCVPGCDQMLSTSWRRKTWQQWRNRYQCWSYFGAHGIEMSTKFKLMDWHEKQSHNRREFKAIAGSSLTSKKSSCAVRSGNFPMEVPVGTARVTVCFSNLDLITVKQHACSSHGKRVWWFRDMQVAALTFDPWPSVMHVDIWKRQMKIIALWSAKSHWADRSHINPTPVDCCNTYHTARCHWKPKG